MTYLDLIVMAQRRSKSIADAFADIEPNNPQCDELFKVLGMPYDEKKWAALSVSTDLFKLTWKQEYLNQVGGTETFYGRILKGEL